MAKKAGDGVVGVAINVSGVIVIRATKVGSDTVLAHSAALVETAQNSKAPAQRIADKAAAILVVVAVGSGVITFVAWTFFEGAPFLTALTFAISAIVIACPDALGLATPTAVAVGTGLGARHHILIKDAPTLEGVSRVQVVVLDKTGTLTEGKPSVTDIRPLSGVTEEAFLQKAAGISSLSTHPLSQATVRAAADRSLQSPPAHNLATLSGRARPGDGGGKRVGRRRSGPRACRASQCFRSHRQVRNERTRGHPSGVAVAARSE